MLDFVGNPEDRFYQGAVNIMSCFNSMVFLSSRVTHVDIRCLANLSSTILPICNNEINVVSVLLGAAVEVGMGSNPTIAK